MLYQKFKNSKSGFTLIEMIIATVILSILMSVTMGMMSSTGRLYNQTARMGIDKQIGDAVYDTIEGALKYSTHLEISNVCYTETDPDTKKLIPGFNSKKHYAKGLYVSEDGYLSSYGDNNTGKKYAEMIFPEDYYNGRTINYSIERVNYNKNNEQKTSDVHLLVTVRVLYKGEVEYQKSNTVTCVNLGLLSNWEYKRDENGKIVKDENDKPVKNFLGGSNFIEYNATDEENQYIGFCCDEELTVSSKEGHELYDHAQELLCQYNYINMELKKKLESNITDEQRKIEADKARQQMKEALGGKSPANQSSGPNDPLRYFDGVRATKEELFYGVLLKHYKDDNKVTKNSYQKFTKENYFKDSVFRYYPNEMVQLVLFYVSDASATLSNLPGQYEYSVSQIGDFNLYSIKWSNWYSSGVDLSNPKNSLGNLKHDDKSSFEECYIMYHYRKSTWFYLPRALSLKKYPTEYDIKNKGAEYVALDIDTNCVHKVNDLTIGFGKHKWTIAEWDTNDGEIWAALPLEEHNFDPT